MDANSTMRYCFKDFCVGQLDKNIPKSLLYIQLYNYYYRFLSVKYITSKTLKELKVIKE